jgi:hypothetical protein
LPLSRAALDVLAGATKIGKKGFVFVTSGEAGIGFQGSRWNLMGSCSSSKRAAFEALAARLDLILNPQANVVH